MNYVDFLKADILCALHDYGIMTAREINSMLGANKSDVDDALYELLLENKISKLCGKRFVVVDELNVKRLKKWLPVVF